MTSAKELAAALSVDPESVALCGEGGFDPWEAVSVRQPPLPPPVETLPSRWGWRLGRCTDEPATNFAGDSNAGLLFFVSGC